jgi:hypothetical protein
VRKPPPFNVSLNSLKEGDGRGSIRLSTPTVEQRERRRPHGLEGADGGQTGVVPLAKATPAARFGYMSPNPLIELSTKLTQKITSLFLKMDASETKPLTRAKALGHFKRFAESSTEAMFHEVDLNHDSVITLEEFVSFWKQVKLSGYAEEDLEYEVDELLAGNTWVDYLDTRSVGSESNEARSKNSRK